jgi:hypothetical protein
LQFLKTGNVQDGAIDAAAGDAVFIQVQANFNFVLRDKSGVVMGNFVAVAVGHQDFEGVEGLGVHELFQLFGIKHSFIYSALVLVSMENLSAIGRKMVFHLI